MKDSAASDWNICKFRLFQKFSFIVGSQFTVWYLRIESYPLNGNFRSQKKKKKNCKCVMLLRVITHDCGKIKTERGRKIFTACLPFCFENARKSTFAQRLIWSCKMTSLQERKLWKKRFLTFKFCLWKWTIQSQRKIRLGTFTRGWRRTSTVKAEVTIICFAIDSLDIPNFIRSSFYFNFLAFARTEVLRNYLLIDIYWFFS